jgi:hypothetical protein
MELNFTQTDGIAVLNTALPASPTTAGVYDYLRNIPRVVNRAASTTPQTTQTAYFTVAGGKVLILDIYGEVTVELGAGANNMKLVSNPTTGADVDMCAQVDTDGDVVGTMYGITGTVADAMISPTSGCFSAQAKGLVVPAGTIDLYASASKAGQTKWTIRYLPLDLGATVVAA